VGVPSDDEPDADKALLLRAAILDEAVQEVLPCPPWLAKTLELTSRYEVSFYDAAHHAIALIHNGLFVTDDTRYVNRVTESGSVESI
jgi:predicted nucleic acid-binding protein